MEDHCKGENGVGMSILERSDLISGTEIENEKPYSYFYQHVYDHFVIVRSMNFKVHW